MIRMDNKERKKARGFDVPMRSREYTDLVYGGGKIPDITSKMRETDEKLNPTESEYHIYVGEMHGHTDLSDASPNIDTYFQIARDTAKLDFCAISDHDHGSPISSELWKTMEEGNFHHAHSSEYYKSYVEKKCSKWDVIREKVKEYAQPGTFTPILAYERDSYPWYNNLVIYFNSYDAEIPMPEVCGDMSEKELREFLSREDMIVVPHTTSTPQSGCDFSTMDPALYTPLIEVYSRWGTDEYYDNPNPVRYGVKGGYWQDALKRGGKMGCIGGSDDHYGMPGMIMAEAPHINLKYRFPGLTGVLAKENTLESIFEAIKARRCYAFMGGRIEIDFRINGHYMGEEITLKEEEDRMIYMYVKADKPIKRMTLVKNCEDIYHMDGNPLQDFHVMKEMFMDYKKVQDTDYYYLRVELEDGRFGWTSPIWVNAE